MERLLTLYGLARKRHKYILEFAYTRILVINDEVYKFKDIVSFKVEKPISFQKEIGNSSEPYVLLIGINSKTNMLVSVTVWSKSVVNEIKELIQEIIKSNKLVQ